MNEIFLSDFLRFALQKAAADRGLACDTRLRIVDQVGMDAAEVTSPDFLGLELAQKALQTGELMVTNNAVSDPNRAPVTNTNFRNLRLVIVIPIPEAGAIYMDRPIRTGMIGRDNVEKLMAVVRLIPASQRGTVTHAYLEELYTQV